MLQRNYIEKPLQVLSCGLGTQSTAMVILVHQGILEKPDVVLFADTGEEMPETLKHLHRVKSLCNQMGVNFQVVKGYDGLPLLDYYKQRGTIPMIGFRSCTQKFKITPQRHYMRSIVGNQNGVLLAESWVGITTDEIKRVRTSDVKWSGLKYPLINLNLSRDDCIKINTDFGWHVGKSGCHCCPYQSGKRWADVKENYPDLFLRSMETENKYKLKRPHRVNGFLNKKNLWLESFQNNDTEETLQEQGCDDGGCFL